MKYFICLTLFLSTLTYADNTRVGHWIANTARVNLDKNTFHHLEAHLRYDHEEAITYQTLINYGLIKRNADKSSYGILYGMLNSAGEKNEHRFSLHYSKARLFKSFKHSLRLRLEQRTLENTNGAPTDRDSQRFRIFNRFDQVSFMPKNFIFWNELFFNPNDGDWSEKRVFDRAWNFIGLRFKYFNKIGNFGYLNQYIPRKDETNYEHMLVLALFI